MCMQNEVPSKRKTIYGWKVFRKHDDNKVRGAFGDECELYEIGVEYTASVNYGSSRVHKNNYFGFHGFFTRDDARDYKAEFVWPIDIVIKRCLFLDIISEGDTFEGKSGRRLRAFRSSRMVIA